ncbi:hypothetical protein Hanom_Chr12g01177571 [Helianthus anomalus]
MLTLYLFHRISQIFQGHVFLFLTQGDAIQAITESRDKISVEPKLNMLMSYRIEHYVCGSISQYHNILSHPVNLRLGSIASIVPTPDNNELPQSYFNFCTYERVEPLCGSKDQV